MIGVLAVMACFSSSASAAVIVSSAPTISGAAHSTGFFEITIQNTGPETMLLYGYSITFGIDDAAGVRFTSASIETALPYVLSGVSAVESDPSTFPLVPPPDPFPGTSFVASDFAIGAFYKEVGPGTYGLIKVGYTVGDADVSGVVVETTPDLVYELVSAVPEPASLVHAALGLAGLAGAGFVGRRRRQDRLAA